VRRVRLPDGRREGLHVQQPWWEYIVTYFELSTTRWARKERAFHTLPTEWCAVCRTSSLRFPSPALANGNPQRARQKPIPTVTKSLHLAPPSRHSNPCSNLLDYVSDSHCSIYMQAHSLGRHDKDLEEPKSGSQCEVLKRETIEMIHSNI
jgi:hypothetical protein